MPLLIEELLFSRIVCASLVEEKAIIVPVVDRNEFLLDLMRI
jgi:hypothetical protein